MAALFVFPDITEFMESEHPQAVDHHIPLALSLSKDEVFPTLQNLRRRICAHTRFFHNILHIPATSQARSP